MAGVAVNPYLAEVFANLGGADDPFAPGAQLAGYGPPSAAPVMSGTPLPAVAAAPNATGFPSLANIPPANDVAPPPPPAVPAGPPAPPPAPGMSSAYEYPTTLTSRAPPPVSQAPTNIQTGVEPGPSPAGPPAPGPDPHAFDLVAQNGGVVPAHEVDLRGPSLINAQNVRNASYEGAIGTVAGRNAEAADNEYQMAVSQERAARLREAAYQQSIAEQDEELLARQDDFDTTARQMARLGQVDHGRFWASRSTGQKIAGAIEVMLAGFRGAPSMVMKRIDDDVRAQEFAYNAARDATQAKQTAFSAAMAKYGNINAARQMARVASLDVVSAQLGQIAAMNKGNETGNRAIEAMAQLTNDRMGMIQQGIKFMPAKAGQRYFVNPRTGVIYNNKEAMAYDAKLQEYGQEDRKQTAGIGGQLLVQRDKAELERGPDGSLLTPEQRGKMEMERIQGQRAADAFNKQMDGILNDPVIKRLGLKTAAIDKVGVIGQYADKKAASDAQHIHAINAEILNALGKIAKDNEGKPGIGMLEEYRRTFNLPLNNPDLARQRIEEARELVNAFNRQQNLIVPSQGAVNKDELPKSFTGHPK